MQPRPRAETSRSFPNVRFCMAFSMDFIRRISISFRGMRSIPLCRRLLWRRFHARESQ